MVGEMPLPFAVDVSSVAIAAVAAERRDREPSCEQRASRRILGQLCLLLDFWEPVARALEASIVVVVNGLVTRRLVSIADIFVCSCRSHEQRGTRSNEPI